MSVLNEWGPRQRQAGQGAGRRGPRLGGGAGAAYYGMVRKGKGCAIRGGTARVYYVGVETARPAVPSMAPPR